MKRPDRLTVIAGLCVAALVSAVGYLVHANHVLAGKLDHVIRQMEGPAALATPATPQAGASAPFIDPAAPRADPTFPNTWDPFREMEDMQQRIDQIFGDAFHHFNADDRFQSLFGASGMSPRMDLVEEDDQFVARVNLPGSDDANINVSIEDNTLKVSATSKQETGKSENGQTLRQERWAGKFERQMTLPKPVEPGTLKTTYEDGVLTITVKKAK